MEPTKLRFSNADDAARLMVKYQRRYQMIRKYFAEITELWHAVANTHLQGSVTVEPLDDANNHFVGTILGHPFEGRIEPQPSTDGVVAKLTITTRDANNRTVTKSTYLFTKDSDVHSQDGNVLIEREHPNCEFLWL